MVLEKEIKELEEMMSFSTLRKESVSKRGIDWHIDHCLKIICGVSDLLKSSNPEDYKWKFNAVRLYIFAKGSIPRGKARSPKLVNNKEEIIHQDLVTQLEVAKNNVVGLENLPPKANFKHPYFGYIKRDKTIKFLALHTNHHLKIMRDIKAASK
jgi:hypothetical protein